MMVGLKKSEVARVIEGAGLPILQVRPRMGAGEIHRAPCRIGKVPWVCRMDGQRPNGWTGFSEERRRAKDYRETQHRG